MAVKKDTPSLKTYEVWFNVGDTDYKDIIHGYSMAIGELGDVYIFDENTEIVFHADAECYVSCKVLSQSKPVKLVRRPPPLKEENTDGT